MRRGMMRRLDPVLLMLLALAAGAPGAHAEDAGVLLLPQPGAAPVLTPGKRGIDVPSMLPMTDKPPSASAADTIPTDTQEEAAKVLPVTEKIPSAPPGANPFDVRIAAFVRADDLDGALAVARQDVHEALERDDGDATAAKIALARVHLHAGRPAEAAAVLAPLLDGQLRDVVTTYAQAEIATGQAREVLPVLAALWQRELAADNGAPVAVPLLVARAERAAGLPAAALALLSGLAPEPADAAAVQYELALTHLAAGTPAPAQAALRAALRDDPGMTAMPAYFIAECASNAAADSIAQTLAERARAPDAPVAPSLAAAALAQARGRPAEADAALTAAEQHFPAAAAAAVRQHAALLASVNKRDAASAMLEAGLRKFPTDPDLLRAASALATQRQDYSRAIAMAQRLLAIDDSPTGGGTPTRYLLGRLYTAGGDNTAAADIYRRLLIDWPNDATAMANLAATLVRNHDPIPALPFARHARDVFPDDAGPAATLGWALLMAGRTDEAVAPLADAARHAPDDPEIRYRLARAQASFGARSEARTNAVAALQITPNFPDAAAARALLMELSE